LVICTIHSDSAIGAIDRIYALANGSAGSPDDVSHMLASGLTGVFHQSLSGSPKKIRVESLWLRGEDSAGPRNIIRSRRFDQLGSEITLQLNRLLMNSSHRG
jgi:Tfp pilus assembly pilus retraction ATPase PilT